MKISEALVWISSILGESRKENLTQCSENLIERNGR